MLIIFFISIALFILLEGTVTTIPMVFISLLCALIVMRKPAIFYTAFFAGLFLDLLTVRSTGSTFLFMLLFFYLVLLYRKKYEIMSYPFVIVSTFLGTYLYLLIFGHGGNLILSMICSVVGLALFSALQIWGSGSIHASNSLQSGGQAGLGKEL